MKLIYLKSALNYDSFDVALATKMQFFEFWLLLSRVAPYSSLQFPFFLFFPSVRYHELFDLKEFICYKIKLFLF